MSKKTPSNSKSPSRPKDSEPDMDTVVKSIKSSFENLASKKTFENLDLA